VEEGNENGNRTVRETGIAGAVCRDRDHRRCLRIVQTGAGVFV